MDIRQLLLDVFQATSLIIVFITVLFGIRYQTIVDDIQKDVPTGELAKIREKSRLWRSFFINIFTQIIMTGMISYLFIPLVVKIVIVYDFQISVWNFDFLPTAFIFIAIYIWNFFVWTIILGFRMLKKILARF